MKTILLSIVLLLFSTTAYCQVKLNSTTQDSLTPSQEQLLAESKSQKRTGLILLMGGIGLVIAGGATYEPNINAFGAAQFEEKDNTLPAVLAVAGLFSIIGGAVQLVTAKESKKKALSVFIHPERVPVPHTKGYLTTDVAPTVGLQITF
ncbi:hypothetical protein [Rufibacter tibetensis]|nr:hypothetical protein [Rufibacter tibetensis]